MCRSSSRSNTPPASRQRRRTTCSRPLGAQVVSWRGKQSERKEAGQRGKAYVSELGLHQVDIVGIGIILSQPFPVHIQTVRRVVVSRAICVSREDPSFWSILVHKPVHTYSTRSRNQKPAQQLKYRPYIITGQLRPKK
ncbi:hypothetical protein PG995_015242 [Apiospora arundinis]